MRTRTMEEKKRYKILVLSDSHGHNNFLRYAIGQETPIDMLIHCGDVEGNLVSILGKGADYEIQAVKGNCDFGYSIPRVLNLKVGFYNIFVAHGDQYGVKYSDDGILEAARQNWADVVLYGHSHVPEVVTTEDNILIVNPGSVAIPHQDPPKRTYAVLTIDEDEGPSAVIKSLPDYIPGNY